MLVHDNYTDKIIIISNHIYTLMFHDKIHLKSTFGSYLFDRSQFDKSESTAFFFHAVNDL